MKIEDVFEIEDRGVVVVGNVDNDVVTSADFKLAAGDSMTLAFPDGTNQIVNVQGVDVFRPPLGTPYGESPKHRGVGILIDGIASNAEIPANSTISYHGST